MNSETHTNPKRMNQQFFAVPAFNQTERHNKNHNKFNEKTSNNVKYTYLFLHVWLTAQKEWRSFLVSLGWSLSEVVVISLKLDGTFVLQYFSPYYCYYVSPPKPNLIVLMGSGKLLGWILTWALIIIFFFFWSKIIFCLQKGSIGSAYGLSLLYITLVRAARVRNVLPMEIE